MDRIKVWEGNRESTGEFKKYAKMEFAKGVEVICSNDSRETCKAMANKKYLFKEAPLIPIDRCTHEKDCICCYAPFVEQL